MPKQIGNRPQHYSSKANRWYQLQGGDVEDIRCLQIESWCPMSACRRTCGLGRANPHEIDGWKSRDLAATKQLQSWIVEGTQIGTDQLIRVNLWSRDTWNQLLMDVQNDPQCADGPGHNGRKQRVHPWWVAWPLEGLTMEPEDEAAMADEDTLWLVALDGCWI
jgi:hypothetical protein